MGIICTYLAVLNKKAGITSAASKAQELCYIYCFWIPSKLVYKQGYMQSITRVVTSYVTLFAAVLLYLFDSWLDAVMNSMVGLFTKLEGCV